MTTLFSVQGLDEKETKELIDHVFDSNRTTLEDLEAESYINLLRQKKCLTREHAEVIEATVTQRKKADILVEKLRLTGEPLEVLSTLHEVIMAKGFQPHIARKLIQTFNEKRKALLRSKGVSANHSALSQPLPGQHNVNSSVNSSTNPMYTTNQSPHYRPSSSTVSAIESEGFDSETQVMVVPRAPYSRNSNTGSITSPPGTIPPPPSDIIGSIPPPPSDIIGSIPPPPTLDNTNSYQADLESNGDDDVIQGLSPPNAGPWYEDHGDGHGPYPHKPLPLRDNSSHSTHVYQDPDIGPIPPPPPNHRHGDNGGWDTQTLNNSLPLVSNTGKGSFPLQLEIPPRQVESSMDSSTENSESFSAEIDRLNVSLQSMERRLDRAIEENQKLRVENQTLRVQNVKLQKQLDQYLSERDQ